MGAGLLLILAAGSCRKQSDMLRAYDHEDDLVFIRADSSFAAKFDIVWNGLNQYYALWDYEAEMGLDWDAVYDEFYPQFAALDKRGKGETVTDEELQGLMHKWLDPLHDGHFYATFKNHRTGSTVVFHQFDTRLSRREDYLVARGFETDMRYYDDPANGEVETDETGKVLIKRCATTTEVIIMRFMYTPGTGYMWIVDTIKALKTLPSLNELQSYMLQQLETLEGELKGLMDMDVDSAAARYNTLQTRYAFLEIPGFDPIDKGIISGNGLIVGCSLFKGNIVYLRLSSFRLTNYLDPSKTETTFDMSVPATRRLVEYVKVIWQTWFDTVQTLHKNGSLGGVIIDLRSNGGGKLSDGQYVVGALAPAGGLTYGYSRYKRGTGRYDYSPLMPAMIPALKQPHEAVTEPIVVLINGATVSMAELCTLCAKSLPNGVVVGKRSFGAICGLSGNETNSVNYAGHVGVKDKTPVYAYVPSEAAFDLDKKVIEAQGITPDIEVDFDLELYKKTGRDSQLDRALEYIRQGR